MKGERNNPTAPRTRIELGGRELSMVLDFNAISAFEEVTGRNFQSLDLSDLGIRETHALIYGALQTDHPDVTFRDVGSWIGFGNVQYVGEKLTELFTNSVPKGKGGEEATPLASETAGASTG